jgi:hypothetical protein
LKGLAKEIQLAENRQAYSEAKMASPPLLRSNSAAVSGLAVMSKGVEYAFTAAGATVALIAVVQSLSILLSWM